MQEGPAPNGQEKGRRTAQTRRLAACGQSVGKSRTGHWLLRPGCPCYRHGDGGDSELVKGNLDLGLPMSEVSAVSVRNVPPAVRSLELPREVLAEYAGLDPAPRNDD